jgi:hypothetical protein
MTFKLPFASIFVAAGAAIVAAAAGCGGSTSTPVTLSQNASAGSVALVARHPADSPYATPTPANQRLYVDHAGILSVYALPLKAHAKPLTVLTEDPGGSQPPAIAVDPYGVVAVGTSSEVRFYKFPITTLAPAAAKLVMPLTPSITEVGQFGAELADIQFDPNRNFWLLNDLGGEVSEVRFPYRKDSVASVIIGFGQPGTKTANFNELNQARFDVSASLYVFASSSNTQLLFKTSFPYGKPPSGTGLDLAQAAFIDSSQYPPNNPNPASLIVGQYFGSLSSPPPQQPPPPPVDRLAQFTVPVNPLTGLFPNATVDVIVNALAADPNRGVIYVLTADTGKLEVFRLPLTNNAKPILTLDCLGGAKICDGKSEHLFTARI